MEKSTYLKITGPMREHPKLAKNIHRANQLLSAIVMASYPILLLWLFLQREAVALVRGILVPMDAFILLSVLRYFIGAKRPYEVFGVEPVIPKKTKGNSFPSRHVFSVFMIAMAYLALAPSFFPGIFLIVIGVLLAFVRVVSGVHFPRDVIAGMLAGVASGVIGFYLIPM